MRQKSCKTKLYWESYIATKWIAIVIVEISRSQIWRSKIFRKFAKQLQSIKIFCEIQNCLKRVNAHAIVAFVAQLIIITYVTKLSWRKLYYELRENQRCKNNRNSIDAHWVVLRWNFNKLNFVNLLRDLRSQNRNAKRCRVSQLIAKFIELNLYKRSKHYNSMRNDRIWIILASLNFVQFII